MKTTTKPVILHIDDDEANRYIVRSILERAGFSVIDAQTGAEGLRLAQDLPDLIILDIRLPDINGFEVCRRIKASDQLNCIPILQTSALFTKSEDKVEGLDSGADGYLAQPIDSAVLVATVRSLLRIRSAEKLAQEATRSREEMLAIVSHDLRNPLTAVMLQTKLIMRTIAANQDIPQDLIGKLERISHSGERMNRLIQDLLDVSSLEGGKFSLVKNNFSTVTLLNDICIANEVIATQNHLKLKVDYPGQDVFLSGDRDRLFQVFSNLVSNSIKFTPKDGQITLGAVVKDDEVIFTVSDTGSGIPQEDLPHVFDRFWQGHRKKKGGVGLGMSIVKGIVEAHQGTVWVESLPDQGTSVFFSIPRTES
ncbi:MAG TPA: ATP-binding protein [Bacteriovoracaceae bacterium]|nr:ATP-binding protein [Bacteriovoracaceae bacterium]